MGWASYWNHGNFFFFCQFSGFWLLPLGCRVVEGSQPILPQPSPPHTPAASPWSDSIGNSITYCWGVLPNNFVSLRFSLKLLSCRLSQHLIMIQDAILLLLIQKFKRSISLRSLVLGRICFSKYLSCSVHQLNSIGCFCRGQPRDSEWVSPSQACLGNHGSLKKRLSRKATCTISTSGS